MSGLGALIKRNTKLFFKDKAMFFTSLITPGILLVLYSTFLSNLYHDSFASSMPEGMDVPGKLINGMVGGQLMASLLAVSCITVAFCCNMLMVQDKFTGARRDLTMTPVKGSTLALGYYISTLISTLIVCWFGMGLCLIYIAATGWYLTLGDVLLVMLDVLILVMFGTALSSVVNAFLTSQGQVSAIGTIVSAGYGFICGAYMPISSFGSGLQKAVMFLPGTYGTAMLKNHVLRGVYAEMSSIGIPQKALDGIRDGVDCNIYFFGERVGVPVMAAVICGTVLLLVGAYILINKCRNKHG